MVLLEALLRSLALIAIDCVNLEGSANVLKNDKGYRDVLRKLTAEWKDKSVDPNGEAFASGIEDPWVLDMVDESMDKRLLALVLSFATTLNRYLKAKRTNIEELDEKSAGKWNTWFAYVSVVTTQTAPAKTSIEIKAKEKAAPNEPDSPVKKPLKAAPTDPPESVEYEC